MHICVAVDKKGWPVLSKTSHPVNEEAEFRHTASVIVQHANAGDAAKSLLRFQFLAQFVIDYEESDA